uniref:Uncharacterized protein n=1 Tax=Arundo donax TaxID=35708 RepID=A0A0A9EQR6_ARUDO
MRQHCQVRPQEGSQRCQIQRVSDSIWLEGPTCIQCCSFEPLASWKCPTISALQMGGSKPRDKQEVYAVWRWPSSLPRIRACQSRGCFLPPSPCSQL